MVVIRQSSVEVLLPLVGESEGNPLSATTERTDSELKEPPTLTSLPLCLSVCLSASSSKDYQRNSVNSKHLPL